ncbi:hypothetical protein ACP4OV_023027 [Aristida adscensionis]
MAMACSTTTVLSLLTALFLILAFTMATVHNWQKPAKWVILHLASVLLYAAAYFRRRLHRRRAGLRRGLGYAVVALGLLLSAIFFCGFTNGMPPLLAVAAWAGLVVSGYFFYRLLVLHLEPDDDEEAAAAAEPLPGLPHFRPAISYY